MGQRFQKENKSLLFAFAGKIENGFTISEILVVIAIAAVLAATSFAGLKALQPSMELNSVARGLVTDLRYAQQSSVSRQIEYGIHFSTSTNGYHIESFGTSSELVLERQAPSGVVFQPGGFTNNQVIFNPYGAVREGGNILLSNTRGDKRAVEVSPSGFVRLK